MTKQGDPNVYSVPLADYDGSRAGGNTMTTENCNNKARLAFGLKLGTEWRNGTITCRAKNSDVFEDGDVEQNDTAILYLIPADFCIGETANTYKANPYSCNKYVQCYNDLSYGRGCGEQCYTGLSVAPLCGDCQTYPCTSIPTTTTTTTQATTTPPPDVFATCSGVNSLIGSSANVTCSVNKVTYSYINVTFTPSKTQTSSHVVDIHPTGVVNDDSGANRDVTVSNAGKDITIAFTLLACSDEGVFHFNVFAVSGDSSTTAYVGVRDTPKTNPTLTSATRVATGHTLSPAINCSGETGYPSGIINLQIKMDGSSSFVNFTEFTKTESSTDDNCAVTKEVLFSGTPTTAINGSYIRCATDHPDAVSTLYSTEELVLVVDGTLCNGKRSNALLYHPYSCGVYITCDNNFLHVFKCGVGAPCIRINETSATGFCDRTCTHCPSYHVFIPGSGK
ncbi:uncharacterized protein LOC110462483 [Mizuhopecten yessoensis]|uniref:uncharacterized protein LOC110462483 n=1 Tax=Mizuhopecten yessoensis TaxID=6573 RepID=UPI000B459688|nr:uncharacterized protein LOC110462483 [Mizuhopecten yessoensis]